jgi:hypothetical protein
MVFLGKSRAASRLAIRSDRDKPKFGVSVLGLVVHSGNQGSQNIPGLLCFAFFVAI